MKSKQGEKKVWQNKGWVRLKNSSFGWTLRSFSNYLIVSHFNIRKLAYWQVKLFNNLFRIIISPVIIISPGINATNIWYKQITFQKIIVCLSNYNNLGNDFSHNTFFKTRDFSPFRDDNMYGWMYVHAWSFMLDSWMHFMFFYRALWLLNQTQQKVLYYFLQSMLKKSSSFSAY